MPPRLVGLGILCSSVLSVVLFALAALSWSGGALPAFTTRGDLLQIYPPQRSLSDIKAGSVTPVSFTLSNKSFRPIRVLGAEWFCRRWGCIQQAGLPLTVPPRSKREVQLMLKAALAGDYEFSTSVTLYLDCPGEPTASVQIKGRVSEGKEH